MIFDDSSSVSVDFSLWKNDYVEVRSSAVEIDICTIDDRDSPMNSLHKYKESLQKEWFLTILARFLTFFAKKKWYWRRNRRFDRKKWVFARFGWGLEGRLESVFKTRPSWENKCQAAFGLRTSTRGFLFVEKYALDLLRVRYGWDVILVALIFPYQNMKFAGKKVENWWR